MHHRLQWHSVGKGVSKVHPVVTLVTCRYAHHLARTGELVDHACTEVVAIVHSHIEAKAKANHGRAAKFLGTVEHVSYGVHNVEVREVDGSAGYQVGIGSEALIAVVVAAGSRSHCVRAVRFF